MDDRVFERLDAASVGRPDLMAGRTTMTLAEGTGTIIAQGGRFGGWSLYVKDGVPAYDYNFLGLKRSSIVSSKPLAPGKATIRFDFASDGGGQARAAWARCSSMANRLDRRGSSIPRRVSSRRMRLRTSASISARPSSKQ
jgi:hypothetical protein